MFNVSDLMDQAVIKLTAEKKALYSNFRILLRLLKSDLSPSEFSFIESLVENPNVSLTSFLFFLDRFI